MFDQAFAHLRGEEVEVKLGRLRAEALLVEELHPHSGSSGKDPDEYGDLVGEDFHI